MSTKPNISLTIVSILALVALIFSGFALSKGSSTNTQAPDSLAKILKTKEMHVCVAEWPPASIKDAKTGKYSGHDIDAYEMIAKEIGATVVYHDTTFGNMPAAIQSGVCDMGTSLFLKISRAAAVDFTRPILYGGDGALVRKGDQRFKSVEDINKAGVKIAVATGESGHIFSKTYLPNATINPIDVEASDLSRFMLEVTSGRADIAIADANTIARFAAEHPETSMLFADKPLDLNPDSFPVRLGDTKLLNFLNNSILSLQVSGEWQKLEKKYNAHWFHENTQYLVR
ncbi:MAG: transporter substrate-binding domain-containing protein [Patescibacteria group bacterium]